MGSLEEVHMPQNGINHPGVTALASAIQHNPDLRILNLNDNTFTKKGALAMAQVGPLISIPWCLSHLNLCCWCCISAHFLQMWWILSQAICFLFWFCLVKQHVLFMTFFNIFFFLMFAVCVLQALRHLRNVQVINFGDCLVRSEGAIALSAVLREGLPILKVSLHEKFISVYVYNCMSTSLSICVHLHCLYACLNTYYVLCASSLGVESVLWGDH